MNEERMFSVNIHSQGTLHFIQALIKYSLSNTLQTKPTTNILENQVAILRSKNKSLKVFFIFMNFYHLYTYYSSY